MRELSRTELSNAIDEWVMNDRDRRLAKRRLIDGVKYEELSEEFSLSVRWTKEIVRSVKETIERHT